MMVIDINERRKFIMCGEFERLVIIRAYAKIRGYLIRAAHKVASTSLRQHSTRCLDSELIVLLQI